MKKLICIFIFMLILLCPMTVNAIETLNSEEELYQHMAKDWLEFKEENTFQINFNIQNIDYERAVAIASQTNQILGNNANSFEWQIKGNTLIIKYGYLLNETEYKLCRKYAEIVGLQLKDDMTDYQKIKAVHDYLCKVFTYDYLANGPFDALLTGLSECEGYSMMFQMMMEYCEIPCKYKTGNMHAWNVVMVDGQWYNIDVTWDDSADRSGCNYDYFLKSENDFKQHIISPECAETNYNADLSYEFDMINVTFILICIIVLILLIIIATIYIAIKIHKKKEREKPREEITFKPYNWSEQRKLKEQNQNITSESENNS